MRARFIMLGDSFRSVLLQVPYTVSEDIEILEKIVQTDSGVLNAED